MDRWEMPKPVIETMRIRHASLYSGLELTMVYFRHPVGFVEPDTATSFGSYRFFEYAMYYKATELARAPHTAKRTYHTALRMTSMWRAVLVADALKVISF